MDEKDESAAGCMRARPGRASPLCALLPSPARLPFDYSFSRIYGPLRKCRGLPTFQVDFFNLFLLLSATLVFPSLFLLAVQTFFFLFYSRLNAELVFLGLFLNARGGGELRER